MARQVKGTRETDTAAPERSYEPEPGYNTDTGEVDRIVDMVDMPDLRTEGSELPVLGWTDTAEVAGGDLTSLGFAKLTKGFAFTGYVLGSSVVDSQFDSVAGKKKQECYNLLGTARVPIQGADVGAFAEVKGRMTIPIYARLQESIDQNKKDEQRLGKPIAVRITYEGKGTDRKDLEGKVLRSGAHIFRVVRVAEVQARA